MDDMSLSVDEVHPVIWMRYSCNVDDIYHNANEMWPNMDKMYPCSARDWE
jgi:hypothetical protein